MTDLSARTRWIAFMVLCLGSLMIVLDTTIVNVALPSIKSNLGFSASALAWVVNAYTLTFGGFLLLSGRLGDLYGHRKIFLIGLVAFTLASLASGLSGSQTMLIAARAIQGIAAAVVSAVTLSLIVNLFTENVERTKAMGFFGFVMAGGGALGVLLGGVLTSALNWHWTFFINIPIGIVVYLLSTKLLPQSHGKEAEGRLDVAGAILVTSSLLLAVYAIVNGNEAGWTSLQTLGLLGIAFVLMSIFLWLESRVKSPLMPLWLFKDRNFTTSNIIGVLWSAAMFAWFFLSALYLQLVLNYNPLQVGLSFLPANLIMGAMSIGLSAKLVMKFGIRNTLTVGMALVAVGLGWLARAPIHGMYLIDILPSMTILGIGVGMAMNPVLLAAMNSVPQHESGLASGMVNTSFMMGGALGLAILASVAASRTQGLIASGMDQIAALNGGYQAAFVVGTIAAAIAALAAFTQLHFKGTVDTEAVVAHP